MPLNEFFPDKIIQGCSSSLDAVCVSQPATCVLDKTISISDQNCKISEGASSVWLANTLSKALSTAQIHVGPVAELPPPVFCRYYGSNIFS